VAQGDPTRVYCGEYRGSKMIHQRRSKQTRALEHQTPPQHGRGEHHGGWWLP